MLLTYILSAVSSGGKGVRPGFQAAGFKRARKDGEDSGDEDAAHDQPGVVEVAFAP